MNLLKFVHFTQEMLTAIGRKSLDGFRQQIHPVIIYKHKSNNSNAKKHNVT